MRPMRLGCRVWRDGASGRLWGMISRNKSQGVARSHLHSGKTIPGDWKRSNHVCRPEKRMKEQQKERTIGRMYVCVSLECMLHKGRESLNAEFPAHGRVANRWQPSISIH